MSAATKAKVLLTVVRDRDKENWKQIGILWSSSKRLILTHVPFNIYLQFFYLVYYVFKIGSGRCYTYQKIADAKKIPSVGYKL